MDLERYKYETDRSFLDYEFFSEGSKGHIKKVVRFQLGSSNGIAYYNLAFGDLKDDQSIDDLINTNNGDAEKVLITVAAIIVDFTSRYPDALLYVEGSTPARTRKYRMGISRLWHTIQPIFEIYGIKEDDTLEPYQKNINYDAFWVRRK